MTSQKPKPRDHAATKAELREMLVEAVRNTQPQPETKSNDTAPQKVHKKASCSTKTSKPVPATTR